MNGVNVWMSGLNFPQVYRRLSNRLGTRCFNLAVMICLSELIFPRWSWFSS